MRHLKGRRKLNRNSSHRVAMLRNMVTAVFRHEKITTTDTRAKELRPIVERIITLSKRVPPEALATGSDEEKRQRVADRVHAYRMAKRWVNDRDVLDKLFNIYGGRFQNRQGGYTRIVKLGFRAGDNAPMSMISLLPADSPVAASDAE